MQASEERPEILDRWLDFSKPVAIVLGVVILLAVDDLNPVKVLCSYARWWEGFGRFCVGCVTEGTLAVLAALWLLAIVLRERERLVYYCFRTFMRCTFNNMFFRSVEIVGMENMPQHGPVILTGNHNNQFVDGMLLATNCSRRISFMIAQKSWDRPFVGFLAKVFQCFPVSRGQDVVLPGTGKVFADGTAKLRGEGTRFLKEVQPEAQLVVEGQAKPVKVKEVLSDTELRLDEVCAAPSGDAAAGLSFKVTPKLDQSAMYEKVFGGLRNGKCLGIFPEGGSHDRTDLLPLKAGVAVIALDAYAKHHMTVPIVPVGLNYFKGHRFGGRVVIEFGPPIVVPEAIFEQYEEDRRGAIGELLKIVATGMRSVIVPTSDYRTLQQIYTVRRLYVPDGLKLSAEQIMDLNRRFAVGIKRILDMRKESEAVEAGTATETQRQEAKLSGEDRCAIDSFRAEIEDYMATLKRLGLRDHQVRQLGWWGVADLLSRLLYLLITVFLGGIPQFMFNMPLMYLASRWAVKDQDKALKASTVKLKGLDVLMSFKVIYVLMLIPCLYVFYAAIILYFTSWCQTTVILVLLMLPVFAFLGMKASEEGVRVYGDIVPLFMRVLPGRRREQDALPARRAELQKKVNHFIKRFGPLLGDLYQMKNVDWAKEMGWFTNAAARAPSSPPASPRTAQQDEGKRARLLPSGDQAPATS